MEIGKEYKMSVVEDSKTRYDSNKGYYLQMKRKVYIYIIKTY